MITVSVSYHWWNLGVHVTANVSGIIMKKTTGGNKNACVIPIHMTMKCTYGKSHSTNSLTARE